LLEVDNALCNAGTFHHGFCNGCRDRLIELAVREGHKDLIAEMKL
jgi:hypothetical protein